MELFFQYTQIVSISLIRYFILAGIPFLLFYKFFLHKYVAAKIQNKTAASTDFKREVWQSIQSTLVIAVVAVIFTKTPLNEYTTIYKNLDTFPLWWIPVSVVLALTIHDTYFYWMHRALHSKKLYRHVHKVHHLSLNPSPWAAYSFHFTEAFAEALILPIIIFVLPIHPLAILLFAFSSFFINVYGHLGFEIAPLWFRNSWLFQLLNTSVHHNLHHAQFNGNYGLYFRVWDRLMGTENPDYVAAYDHIQKRRTHKEASQRSSQKVATL
jgi:lathosterol oxidase